MAKLPTTNNRPVASVFDSLYPHLYEFLVKSENPFPSPISVDLLHSLIDSPQPASTIQKLAPATLYKLFFSLDWEESRELVPFLSSYQFQCMIDMDCWSDDLFLPRALEKWLDALCDLAPDTVFNFILRDLDPEIPAFLYKENLIAEPIVEDQDPFADQEIKWYLSPDGVYALSDIGQDDSTALIRKLTNRLYDVDRVLAWTLIEASIWETFSDMQHFAFRWRTSRMEELGFPNRTDAFSIYTFAPPSALLKQWKARTLPQKRYPKNELKGALELFAHIPEPLLLFDSLNTLHDDALLPHILRELVTIQNHALIADGVEPGNLFKHPSQSTRAIGYLNLGLEFLSQNDPYDARIILTTLPLRQIFSVGYSCALTLRKQIEELSKRSLLTIIQDLPFSLLNATEDSLARALTSPIRPETVNENLQRTYFLHLEQINSASNTVRSIALKQLWTFTTLAANNLTLSDLVMSPNRKHRLLNDPADITFDLLFLNANANTIIGRENPFQTFDAASLSLLLQRIKTLGPLHSLDEQAESPLFAPFLEQIATDFPADVLTQASQWLTATLNTLIYDLAALAPSEIEEEYFIETAEYLQPLLLFKPVK